MAMDGLLLDRGAESGGYNNAQAVSYLRVQKKGCFPRLWHCPVRHAVEPRIDAGSFHRMRPRFRSREILTNGYADNNGLRMDYKVHRPAVPGQPPPLRAAFAVPDEFWDSTAKAALADMPATYQDAGRLLFPGPGQHKRLFELDRRSITDFSGSVRLQRPEVRRL